MMSMPEKAGGTSGTFRGLMSRLLDLVLEEVPADAALVRAFNAEGEVIFEAVKSADERRFAESADGRAGFGGLSGFPRLEDGPAGLDLPETVLLEDGPAGRRLFFPWKIDGRPAGFCVLGRALRLEPFNGRDLELVALFLAPAVNVQARSWAESRDAAARVNHFIGDSEAIRRVRDMIARMAATDAPVFIFGESGTGKELAARAVHETSRRRGGPFVAVNCGAIPEALLESELFGYARGAFTGAFRDKAGLIEAARGGTFFLDEVGDMPLALQAKLLRVLEEKRLRRVGENRTRPVEARFVSATNKDLDREVASGAFRQDLYYRLKIFSLELPPLRHRKEDVYPLADHFLGRYAAAMNRPRPFFSPGALEKLVAYSWPGNVRELQNEIQRCLLMAGDELVIREECLSARLNPGKENAARPDFRFFEARAEFEKRFLREALARSNYNRSRAAAEVGLTRQGLLKLLKRHGLLPRLAGGPPQEPEAGGEPAAPGVARDGRHVVNSGRERYEGQKERL